MKEFAGKPVGAKVGEALYCISCLHKLEPWAQLGYHKSGYRRTVESAIEEYPVYSFEADVCWECGKMVE